MDKETYKSLLKKAGLTNKKLAELLGTHHQTVNNWTARGYPYWLESWLYNYIKANTLENAFNSVKDVIYADKRFGSE